MTFTALPLGLPLAQQNAWTLTYEWAFYLFVATAWTMIVSPRRRQFTYAIIASAALVACAVFPICCYFVIGMMFSFLRTKINIGRVQECVLVPICVMAFFYGAEFVSYFAAIPPALLIFWVVLQDGSLTSRLLRIPALQYCGKISYSLYLIHPIAMFPYQSLGAYLVRRNFNSSILFGAFVVLGVSTTMAASIVSYAWLEVRLRNQVVLWISARTQAKKAVLF
jgi:peptidoglycan/LPS O-acetylase OafA/YrhL